MDDGEAAGWNKPDVAGLLCSRWGPNPKLEQSAVDGANSPKRADVCARTFSHSLGGGGGRGRNIWGSARS